MTSDDGLPIIYESRGLRRLGRLILLAGGIYCLWVWLDSPEPSWTMAVICACWFLPALAAPYGWRTVIDRTAISWETRWPWGTQRSQFSLKGLRDFKIAIHPNRFGRRQPVYSLSFRASPGKWRTLASYSSREGAETMAGLLHRLVEPQA